MARGAQTDVPGPVGSGTFGSRVIYLPNGNFIVTDPGYDRTSPTTVSDVGAVHLYNGTTLALISTLTGSTAGDSVGSSGVEVLPNGNFLVRSPFCRQGAVVAAGAVTWVNGTTGLNGVVSAANSLVGSTGNDQLSFTGVTVLTNGNYVVRSANWDNGAVINAGAVTWCSGAGGTVGVVSAANSLVGTTADDQVGSAGVTALTNGNYVVGSPNWDNGAVTNAGAATWGDGTTGIVGEVSPANSLVGTTANDLVSTTGVTALTNGNYVVRSATWDNGAVSGAGAATWGNGTGGTVGVVSAANSLVGTTANDQVSFQGLTALTNGHYVVVNPLWDNGAVTNAGAATWCNGTGGTVGTVSAANSLVGTTANDTVSSGGVIALSNGNYVVGSPSWDNGAVTNVGAATWCNGTTGTTGVISAANSLVGATASDAVSSGSPINLGLIALTNGNYVVRSEFWDNGAVTNVGAVTWCNGTTGTTAVVSAANSLIGSTAADQLGSTGVTALTNGNYVVLSANWDNGAVTNAGAATWGNGTTGTTGAVSAANSLVGTTANDNVSGTGVTALNNGNYVVRSVNWDNGAATNVGAATWGNGTTGTTGAVSAANSLVGTTANDNVSGAGVTALTNGNYVVRSSSWDNATVPDAGAVTLGEGTAGTVGPVSAANSMLGTLASGGSNMVFSYYDTKHRLLVGQSLANRVSIFSYTAPAVTGITPNTGSMAGGTVLTISGTGFEAGAGVKIGGVDATVTSVSPTSITAITGAHAAGVADVVVTAGVRSPGGVVSFTYLLPTIVTNTADIGAGSLRQAVLNANTNPGADTITFDPTAFATTRTIVLASGLPAFTADTTVTAPAAGVNVQGASGATSFAINAAANVSLTGLTFTNGNVCVSNSGTATVSNCEFSASTNTGIINQSTGTLVVNDSTIRSTYAVTNSGTASMAGCTVITGASEAALNNSDGGTLTLINCTALDGNGTHLFNNQGSGSTVLAIHCTLIESAQSDNVGGATLTLKNSIFRTNTANTVFTDGGGNRVMNITGTLAADLADLGLDPTGPQDNGGPTQTIALLSGTSINGALAANVPIGLTSDQRGSGFPRAIGNVDIGAFEAPAPTGPKVRIATGDTVPSAPGTTFARSTGLPGANAGDIGTATIKLPSGKNVNALVGNAGIICKVGDTLAGADSAEIAKLDSMSFGVFQAELKVGTGSPAVTLATNKVVCFDNGSGVEVLARSGQTAPGGSTFKSFRASCGDVSGNVFIAAILNDARNVDSGLWAIPAGGTLTLLVKEGQTIDIGNGPNRVNSISSFPAGGGSQAEGRVHYGSDSIITRITIGTDHAIVGIPADATGVGDWTVIARTSGNAPGAIGEYLKLGIPAAEGTNVVFTAGLKTSGTVTAGNNTIVVADGAVIAREGDTAPGTSGTFLSFGNVAAGSTGQTSFTANITGATPATDSGLWEYRNATLSLVARQGEPAPNLNGVTIASITRFAHPGGGLGPVFTATLGGATTTTNVGLFGVLANGGAALNLARTGDQFDIGGTMQTLTAINALKMDLGNEGIARGYDHTSVLMIGSFGRTRTALIELPIVP